MSSPAIEHEAGNDWYLNVAINVVGLLIIALLIAVSSFRKPVGPPAADSDTMSALSAAHTTAARMEGEVHSLNRQMKIVQAELAARSEERLALATVMKAVEQKLAGMRGALDEDSRQQYDLNRDLAIARAEFDRLQRRKLQTEPTATKVEQVDNFPTAISKTVNGKEMHIQVKNQRIAIVPLDELLARFKSAAQDKLWKLQDQPEMSDTVGPINGFRLKYTLERVDIPAQMAMETGRAGSYVQLTKWELIPVSGQLGETLEEAIQNDSTFRSRLSLLSPRDYTLTLWVYNDSFEEFRALRKELYHLGYSIAGRPLPEGVPIGGSPHGTKSAAE